jgi:hypothetical protein
VNAASCIVCLCARPRRSQTITALARESVRNAMSPAPHTEHTLTRRSIFAGRAWLHILLLVVAATAVTYPYLAHGLPPGHDSSTHITYQHFFNEQISSGERYPRWIYGFNGGLGSAIFFVQYPLPYYVAWGLEKMVPNQWGIYRETRSQGLGIVLATILAALFAYAWCASFSDRLSAAMAALVYITLPYFLTIDLYMRASVGELWAMSFLPLCFFFLERMSARSRRALPGLAVAFAALILSHLFTAVLFAPTLLLYAIWRADRGRRALAATQTIAALALATGLSGIYAFPLLYQRHLLDPLNLILIYGGNFSPLSQMFSYNARTFPTQGANWHRLVLAARVLAAASAAFIGVRWYRSRHEHPRLLHLFLAFLSALVLVTAALAGYVRPGSEISGALPLSDKLIEQRAEIFVFTFLTFEAAIVCYWSIRDSRHKGLANLLMLVTLASYLMMTSWSQLIWKIFHFLWNIQFPWRFNEFLGLATAGLCALSISELQTAPRSSRRLGIFVALLLWGLVAVQPVRIRVLHELLFPLNPLSYETDADGVIPVYAQGDPRQAMLAKPPADKRIHVDFERGAGVAVVTSVRPRMIELEANCDGDCTLKIGQYFYPLWQATSSPGEIRVPLAPASASGLMELRLPPGEHHLKIELPWGWSERAGEWASLLCLLLIAILVATGVGVSLA